MLLRSKEYSGLTMLDTASYFLDCPFIKPSLLINQSLLYITLLISTSFLSYSVKLFNIYKYIVPQTSSDVNTYSSLNMDTISKSSSELPSSKYNRYPNIALLKTDVVIKPKDNRSCNSSDIPSGSISFLT